MLVICYDMIVFIIKYPSVVLFCSVLRMAPHNTQMLLLIVVYLVPYMVLCGTTWQ